MTIIQCIKEYIRDPYAWPGGYPKILVMSDSEVLCADCAKENFRLIVQATKDQLGDGWQAEGVGIHWEGESHACAHCGFEIESAYGVPDEERICKR